MVIKNYKSEIVMTLIFESTFVGIIFVLAINKNLKKNGWTERPDFFMGTQGDPEGKIRKQKVKIPYRRLKSLGVTMYEVKQ